MGRRASPCDRLVLSGHCSIITLKHIINMAEFKHGIFGCFDNIGLCCKFYICMPCMVGKVGEAVGAGSCMACGLATQVPCLNIYAFYQIRKMGREKIGMEGGPVDDFIYGVA